MKKTRQLKTLIAKLEALLTHLEEASLFPANKENRTAEKYIMLVLWSRRLITLEHRLIRTQFDGKKWLQFILLIHFWALLK